VVGYNLPSLRQAVIRLNPGDVLIFVTDGIRSGFVRELSHPKKSTGHLLDRRASLTQTANHILTHYGRETDDAMVLVARYVAGPQASG
jgi:serine phosphatase RsbU (regulator of sigma subunit)